MTPSHKSIIVYPNGKIGLLADVKPTGKADVVWYCKYCYRTHGDWWVMDEADYSQPVLLCGNCEHTSLRAAIDP